jgi:hypothetical protein
LFFISDGFLPNFVGSDYTTVHGRVTHAAARGGVVIYTLDARGLSTDSALDASSGGGFDPSGVAQSRLSGERSFMQEPLHALAADTGGRALLNSNDLAGGIARALDETSRYYLLAWTPLNDAQRASNFSKIKVTVAGRPELKVQLRRGYLGVPAEKPKNEPAAVVQHALGGWGSIRDFRRHIGYIDMMGDPRLRSIPSLLWQRLSFHGRDCLRLGPTYLPWYDWPLAAVFLAAIGFYRERLAWLLVPPVLVVVALELQAFRLAITRPRRWAFDVGVFLSLCVYVRLLMARQGPFE